MSDQQFFYDDFFASDTDPGVTVYVKMRGREVPIVLRRGLTLADKNACQTMALKKHMGPNGQVVYDGIDESVMVEEMIVRSILSWPFQMRDGTPVPVTRESVRRMLGGTDQLAELIKKLDEEGTEALVPFAQPSAAA